LVLLGQGRPELGGPGVPGDGRGSGRPQRHGQGSAARREAPWRRPPRRAGTEALGQRLDTAHAGITRLRPKSFRCQLTRALGLQRRITPKRARRTSMTSTDDDLSHSCGGDMSTPQKCLPTRHYLQTTSDNRRSVRPRWVKLARTGTMQIRVYGIHGIVRWPA
jgi:hypothetical protein